MTWRRWLLRVSILLPGLLAAGLGIVLGTAQGTRWLYALAESRLPPALSVEGLDGSLLAGIRASRVVWDDDAATISAAQIDVAIKLLPLMESEVWLSRLHIGSLDVELRDGDEASDTDEPPAIELPFTLRLDDALVTNIDVRASEQERRIERLALVARMQGSALRVSSFLLESDWLTLSSSGSAVLEPPYAATLDAGWRWTPGDGQELAGDLDLEGDWSAYRIRHALDVPYAIRSDGEIEFEDFSWSVNLANEWELIERPFGDTQLRARQGRLTVVGNLDQYDAELDATIEAEGFPAAVTRIAASGDLVHLDIREASVNTDPVAFTAVGRIAWAPALDWAVDVDVQRLDPGWLDERLDGELRANGRLEGRWRDEDAVDADVSIETLGGTLNSFPVTGSATARMRGNRVDAISAAVNVGRNRARLDGSVDPDLGLSLRLDAEALDELFPELGGQLAVEAEILGSTENPTVRADIRSEGIRWNEIAAERLVVEIDGRRADHSVSASVQSGSATVSAELRGGLAGPRWKGQLRSMALDGERLGQWALEKPAELAASAQSVSINGYCIGRNDVDGNLCVDAELEPESGDINATFDSRGVPLNALVSGVSDEVQGRGTLRASGEAQIGEGRFDGRLNLAIEDGGLSAQYEGDLVTTLFEEASLQATIDDGRLAGSASLVLSDGLGQVAARVAADDLRDAETPIDANLTMAIDDLTGLALFAPEVSRPAGRLEGALFVGGTAVAPEFRGSVGLREGRFEVPAAGISIADLDVELSQSRIDELTIRGSATSGEGTLAISGQTSFRTPTGVRTVLNVTGQDVELLRIPDRQITASPDLQLEFDDSQVELSGVIRIPSANFVIDELPRTAVSTSSDAVVHRDDLPSSEQRRYSIDVRAELGDSVHIEGFGLSTDLEGALQVQSRSGAVIRGNGRLALVDGRYKAYGQDLTIEQGELLFNGPLDRPDLNIRATRNAGDVVAGVQLTGTPDQLRSTVFSEPVLTDAEALSYLLTGRALSSASADEGNTLNEAAFALGLSQAGAVTSQIQNTLGLDTLTVEGGAESGRIVAGRRLGGRLFVEYGYGLVDQLGTLLLRLQLTDRIVVESSSGSTTTLNIVYSVTRE